MRISEIKRLAVERGISDPAYRTWVVAEEMEYSKGRCTQVQIAKAREISRQAVNRHLKEVRDVTKTLHPYNTKREHRGGYL